MTGNNSFYEGMRRSAAIKPREPKGWILGIAIFLVVIGLVKVVNGLLSLTIHQETKERIRERHRTTAELLNPDPTAAGLVIDFVLLVIGAYTLTHGLVMLDKAPPALFRLFSNPWIHVAINGAFGLFCIVFYALVLYDPRTKINHDDRHATVYRILGLGGGILLIAAAALAFVCHNVVDLGGKLWTPENIPFLVVAMVLFAAFLFLLVTLPGTKRRALELLAMTAGNVVALM